MNRAQVLDFLSDARVSERSDADWYHPYAELVDRLTSVTPDIDRRIDEVLSTHSRKLVVARHLMGWRTR